MAKCRLDEFDAPQASFDAVVALSAIEHFGLGHYVGEERGPRRGDLDAMRRFAGWLKPDGILVLTVPYGQAGVDEFQRVYDARGLQELLDGWTVRSRRFVAGFGKSQWAPCDETPGGRRAVALVIAQPGG